MKDKREITIHLADLNRMGMVVKPEEEEDIRRAEFYVNHAWSKWMDENGAQLSSKDILGMVAHHFAKLFIIEQRKNEKTDAVLRKMEEDLDNIIHRIY